MPSAVRLLRATLASVLIVLPASPALAETNANVPEAAYARIMRTINPHLALGQSRVYATTLLSSSRRMHLDPRLVMAVVTVESHWDENAVSPDGAIGLGQLKISTAHNLGVDARSGRGNLLGIARYLHRLLGIFRTSRSAVSSAIASYNAGPLAVEAAGGAAPGYAAQHYVAKVLATWRSFQARLGSSTAVKPSLVALESLAANVDREQASYWGAH